MIRASLRTSLRGPPSVTEIGSMPTENVSEIVHDTTREVVDSSQKIGLNSSMDPTSHKTAGAGKAEDLETYDELVIYEELGSTSDDGYQDIEQARIEALGLPKNIRTRASRIVKGRERKKLRRSLQIKSRNFSEGSIDHPTLNFADVAKRRTTENGPSLKETKETGKDSPVPEEKFATPSHDDSSSEDDTNDGYMSHKKALQVLDMLLEANNVKKVAHRKKTIQRSQSVHCDPTTTTTDDDAAQVILPPEVEEYQKAGLLQTKSTSEIAAEIKFLTESAPQRAPATSWSAPTNGECDAFRCSHTQTKITEEIFYAAKH